MKAIERAKTHFAEQDVRVIKVPEWGEEDKPLEIYSKPLTLSETSKLYKMSKNDELSMMAYVLIYKALDENGDKLFTLDDKGSLLNNVDQEVLVRVATQIMGQEPIEDVKKKLIEDVNLYSQYALAEKLGKTLQELQKISIQEYQGWIAYFELAEERQKNGK